MRNIMKDYFKRYWHNIPFLGLAIRAVLLTSLIWGLITFAYFFFVVVPIEVKYYKQDLHQKAIQQYKIKKGIA